MWHEYEAGDAVFKTKEPVTLWKTDQGFVEVGKDTLAVAVKSGEKQKGFVFHGQGKLVLDAIVETESGAVGEPVEKELSKPFLMLGETEQVQQRLGEAVSEDLAKMGYKSNSEFADKAKDLLERSLNKGRMSSDSCCHHSDGSMFMFPNETGEPDVLMLHDSKLIYKSSKMVFMSNDGKAMLKSPMHVVMSNHGKCVLIRG
jgi:hypothetical protein